MPLPTSNSDSDVDLSVVPQHVAVIMDGNGRWARQHGLAALSGHKKGQESVKTTIEFCARLGVKVLTLFAFSSENWQRPAAEVKGLMELFHSALKREIKQLHENNLKVLVIGDLSRFSPALQQAIAQAQSLTQHNSGMVLAIAANYGGQWDIVNAAQQLCQQVQHGQLQPGDVTAERLQHYLCLGDLPPPDLLIRTSGEQRISNFLLWQLAYAELYFTPVYWPDVDHSVLQAAFAAFAQRQRRFGKTGDQQQASRSG